MKFLSALAALVAVAVEADTDVLPPCIDTVAKTIDFGTFPGIVCPLNTVAMTDFFYQATGYKARWRRQTNGIKAIRYMEGGDLCGGAVGSAPAAYGLAREMDVYSPSLWTIIFDSQSLVVRPDIFSPKDLKGKTIATFVGSTADYHLRIILDLFNLADDVVVYALSSQEEAMKMWDDGDIDGIHSWAPSVTHALQNGGKKMIGGEELAGWGRQTFIGFFINGPLHRLMPNITDAMVDLIGAFGTANKEKAPFDWADKTSTGFKMMKHVSGQPDDGIVSWSLDAEKTPTPAEMKEIEFGYGSGFEGAGTKAYYQSSEFTFNNKVVPVLPLKQFYIDSVFDGKVALESYQRNSYDLVNFNWTAMDNIADEYNHSNAEYFSTMVASTVVGTEGVRCSGATTITADGSFSDGRPAFIAGQPTWKPVYPENADCTFNLEHTSSTGIVELTFSFIHMETGFDFVTVYDANDAILGRFTGSTLPNKVTGVGKLRVHFVSDSSPSTYIGNLVEMGFDATVAFTTGCTGGTVNCGAQGSCGAAGLCECNAGYYGSDCSLTDCYGKHELSSTGTIETMYAKNAYCVWELSAASGKYVELVFSEFSTESYFDKVRIYSGTTEDSSNLLAEWSGQTVPPKLVSPGDKMLVVLETDNLKNYAGFTAAFSSVDQSQPAKPPICDNGLFGPFCDVQYCFGTHEFSILGTAINPKFNRAGGMTCNYELAPASGEKFGRVRVNFTTFDIEPSLKTVTDTVNFYVNDEVDARVSLRGVESTCSKQADCIHGTCVFPSETVIFGTCECEPGWLNGDCSVDVVEIDASESDTLKIVYSTDINDGTSNYTGWRATISACTLKDQTGTYDACVPVTVDNSGAWIAPAVGGFSGFIVALGVILTAIFLVNKRKQRRVHMTWWILSDVDYEENAGELTDASSLVTTLPCRIARATSHFAKNTHIQVDSFPGTPTITRKAEEDLFLLRSVNHDNLKKFLGMSIEPNGSYLVGTPITKRGNLRHALSGVNFEIDSEFKEVLIIQLASGLAYLKAIGIRPMGNLSPSCVFIDSKWTPTIANFGLNNVHSEGAMRLIKDEATYYIAPELASSKSRECGETCDVFSFGLICYYLMEGRELHTAHGASCDGMAKMLKNGKFEFPIQSFDNDMLAERVKSFIKKNPEDRPCDVTAAQTLLTSVSGDLMPIVDKLAASLEHHAKNLDGKLKTQLQRADQLLGQLFPGKVAEQLRQNKTVAPENFQEVTIFFSDIINFTNISATLTPEQCVVMLDELYKLFDSTIAEFDVYKVETIGDAYMLASGLPERNGSRHAVEICRAGAALIKSLKTKKFDVLGGQMLSIRAGAHTGPVVAAIVGDTMPRYTIIGDTVNTASRMESNSLEGRLHVSTSTRLSLDRAGFTGFTATPREIEVKGKGIMNTFFIEID